MKPFTSIRMSLVFAFAPVVVAAASPSVFNKTQGGLWQVDRAGEKPLQLCLANTAELALFEHRKGGCTPKVIRDSGSLHLRRGRFRPERPDLADSEVIANRDSGDFG